MKNKLIDLILQNDDYAITCDTLVLFGEDNEVNFKEKDIEFRYVNSSVNISIKTKTKRQSIRFDELRVLHH